MVSDIATAAMIFVFSMVGILYLIIYVMTSLGYMGCMKKAGEATWKAWVPLYNDYTMYKIVNLKGFLIVFKVIQVIIAVIYLGFTLSFFNDALNKVDDEVNNSIYRNSYSTSDTVSINKNKYSTNKNTSKSDYEFDEKELREIFGTETVGMMIFSMLNSLFSIVVFVISIFFAINISKAYGLGGGTIAGMILIPHIFILIIGFGSSEYKGSYQPVNQVPGTDL